MSHLIVEFLNNSELATRNVMKIARSLDIHVPNNLPLFD